MRNKSLLVLGFILGLSLICLGSLLLVGGLVARGIIPWSGIIQSQALPGTTPAAESQAAGGPSVGAPAPNFSAMGIDKQSLKLDQFRGKPVVLNFWATWCAPCSAEMPNLETVYQKHPNDIVILAVNQGESADQVSGYADIYRLHLPLLLDPHMATGDLYRVNALPTTVFIDARGIIQEVHIGGPMSVDFIEGHVKKLLGQ